MRGCTTRSRGEARVHLLDLREDRLRLLLLGADRGVGGRRAGADEQERREGRDGEAEERSLSRQMRHAASRWPDEGRADGGVTGHKSGSLAATEDVCTRNRRENLCKQPQIPCGTVPALCAGVRDISRRAWRPCVLGATAAGPVRRRRRTARPARVARDRGALGRARALRRRVVPRTRPVAAAGSSGDGGAGGGPRPDARPGGDRPSARWRRRREIATLLRRLYMDGDADPIAVLLGARSLPGCSRGSTGSSARRSRNRRLAAEAERTQRTLRVEPRRLARARAELAARGAACGPAVDGLEAATAAKRHDDRRDPAAAASTRARVAALESRAQAAQCGASRADERSRARASGPLAAPAQSVTASAAAAPASAPAARDDGRDARRRRGRLPPARPHGERPAGRRRRDRRRPVRDPARHAGLRPRLRAGRRGRRRLGDQGGHHRPLDAEHRGGAGLGAAHRHDHRLRLAAGATPARALLGRDRRDGRRRRRRAAVGRPRDAAHEDPPLAVPLARADGRDRGRPRRPGDVLFAHNRASRSLPASNEKLPVSWAALDRLGPGFRFTTEVLGVGDRAGRPGTATSCLKGYGDPTLTSADLDRLAAPLRARGIRRVTGRIRGDESAFDERRGAAGLEALLPRRRDPAALGARRRPRARLAGALAAAARGTRAPRALLARRGDGGTARPGSGGRRPTPRVLADRPLGQPLAVDRPDDEPRQRQLHRRDAAQAARHARRPGRHDRARRTGRRRGDGGGAASPSRASGSSTAPGCPRSTGSPPRRSSA